MVDKTLVEKLKNNAPKFDDFVSSASNKDIKYVLDKLGELENNNLKKPLLKLLKHKDDPVRALAVKNLAKMKDESLIKHYIKLVKNDKSSIVRREGADAIGRSRMKKNIPVLFDLLDDSDPSVCESAIRGLLAFKKEDEVKNRLLELKNHPNERIQDVIGWEFKEKSTEKKEEHAQSMDLLKNLIVQADVQDVLKEIKSENIHLTFTSPPYYNARDYSIYKSYKEYLHFLRDVFQEVHRVTKEGRFFLLNTSPVIAKRFSRSHSSRRYPIPYDLHHLMMDIGWEFIDDIVWLKPEASVKDRIGGFRQHRKPLGYKPNARHEMVMVYRKKTNKLLDWNMKQYDEKTMEQSKIHDNDYETSNIWKIDPASDKVHRAVFPIELCRRVVKFYSYKGDLVFDPFAGSGTLAEAALGLDRFFLMTEDKAEYVARIEERVAKNETLKENYKKPEIMELGDFQKKIKENYPPRVDDDESSDVIAKTNEFSDLDIKEIIRALILHNRDSWRIGVIDVIDAEFLRQLPLFLERVKTKKSEDPDWYEKGMIHTKKDDEKDVTDRNKNTAWNAGWGTKTIKAAFGNNEEATIQEKSRKRIKDSKKKFADSKKEFDILSTLKLTFGDDTSLESTDTLRIIRALAARYNGINGSYWSKAGKITEIPLMNVLCRMLKVKPEYYDQERAKEVKKGDDRQVDFYLLKSPNDEVTRENVARVEIKLMNRGNPESADKIWARGTKVFIADHLSDSTKKQIKENTKVLYVAMDDGNTLKQFADVLEELNIPCTRFEGNLEEELEKVLKTID